MKVLTIILGVLLAICGVICLTSPEATFVETGYVVAIMLLVYGVIGIIGVIARRVRPSFLWACIPAIIIGVISLFFPSDKMNIHIVLVYLLAVWFILQGISSIYMAVRVRFFDRGWFLGLIVGILSICLGVYTALHPTLGAFTIGVLVGIYMIEAGIDLIVIGAMIGRVESVAKGAQAVVDGAKEAFNEAYNEVMGSFEQNDAPGAGSASDAADAPGAGGASDAPDASASDDASDTEDHEA